MNRMPPAVEMDAKTTRAKLEVGADLDVQVMAPRQNKVFGKAIRSTSQAPLSPVSLAVHPVPVGSARMTARVRQCRAKAVWRAAARDAPFRRALLLFALFEKGVEHLCPELSLIGVLVSGQLRGHERNIDIQGQHNRVVVTEALGRQVDAW